MKHHKFSRGRALPAVAAWVAIIAAPLSATAADVQKGAELFKLCVGCHSTAPNEHRFGPSLSGVYNRPAGSVKGYAYSDALKHGKFRWNDARLRQWLSDEPKNTVPGTLMEFPGIGRPDDVSALIGYIKTLK